MYIIESSIERNKKRLEWLEEQRKAQSENRKKLSAYVSVFTTLSVFLAVVIFTHYYSTPFATGVACIVGFTSMCIARAFPIWKSTIFNVTAATFIQLFFNVSKTAGNGVQNYTNTQCEEALSLFNVIIRAGDADEAPPRCPQLGTNIYEGADSASSNFGFDLVAWVFVELGIYLGIFSLLFFGVWFFCQKKYGYWDWPDKLADKIRN